jgi:hypothetical protein
MSTAEIAKSGMTASNKAATGVPDDMKEAA